MTPAPPAEERHVQAWDLPVRLFHWALVLLVASAWISYRFAETVDDVTLVWHRWNGLTILTLVVWRLLWGIVGSPTARFSAFVRSPSAAGAYVRDLVAGRSRRFLGHNPLGAYMVLALLAALAAQGSFGLFAVDDNDLTGGPLYRLVSEATNKWATGKHALVFHYVILPLVAIHIAANVLYGLVKKEPLIRAMITGRKPAGAFEDIDTAAAHNSRPERLLPRAALVLAIAAALVLGTILGLGGKL
jgi:cytochrome b